MSSHSRRFIIICFVVVLTLAVVVSAGLSFAGQFPPADFTVEIMSASCTQVVFSYVLNAQSSGGADFARISVFANGDLVAGTEEGDAYEDTVAFDLTLSPAGSPYLISVVLENDLLPATGSDEVVVECEDDTPVDTDIEFGRVCFGPGAVAATVFFFPNRIEVYAINPNDEGELVMSFTQEYLRSLPTGDTEARLLGDSDLYIPIEFYRNVNGLYRIVAGPDAEGKTFQCTFGGACSIEQTWIGEANRPAGEASCQPPAEPTAVPTPTPEPALAP